MVLQGIWDYITTNWVGISITAVITVVITLLSVYLTNRAFRDYVTSAREERISQAKDDLIGILENQIINRKEISTDKVHNLIEAVEREHSVNLSDQLTPVTLLQDLELRIEQSSHLDTEQKEKYGEKIEKIIANIEEKGQEIKELPPEIYHAPIIEDIEDALEADNVDGALDLIEKLKAKVEQEAVTDEVEFENPFLQTVFRIRDDPVLRVLILIVYIVVIFAFISSILF
jgi:hypothetical protein